MAKQSRSVKHSQAVSHQGKGHTFEQHESFDDSLLPDAAELARLKELDPDIINWIKQRTEKEQDARLDFNARKMRLVEKSTAKAFSVDVLTIICALTVIIVSMAFSYFLINADQMVTGTIFAGATIILSVNSFLNFRKRRSSNKGDERSERR